MRVRMDAARCTGHAQCYAISPEYFPINDLGYSVLEPHEVRVEDEAPIRRGAAACPEAAIEVDEG